MQLILKNCIYVNAAKRKIKSFSRVHVPHKREIRKFHIVVVQQLPRNVQKSAKLLLC